MKAALVLFLVSIFPATLSCAVSEDAFIQAYAASVVPYLRDNAVAGEIRMDDGATLGYQSIRSPKERGIVVLLGGHSESYVKYAELFFDLRDLGITFYALDLRGQGFSTRMLPDREKDFIPAYDRYLADLKAFMELGRAPPARGESSASWSLPRRRCCRSIRGTESGRHRRPYPFVTLSRIESRGACSAPAPSAGHHWPGQRVRARAEDRSGSSRSSRMSRRTAASGTNEKCRTTGITRKSVSDIRPIIGW